MITVAVFGCADHPGGSVGDPCETSGETAECASGEVCDTLDDFGGDAFCLRICDEHADCEAGELCNGVSGSNQKGCQPAGDEPLDDG